MDDNNIILKNILDHDQGWSNLLHIYNPYLDGYNYYFIRDNST